MHAAAAAAEGRANGIAPGHDDLEEEGLFTTPTPADVQIVLNRIGVVKVLRCLNRGNRWIVEKTSEAPQIVLIRDEIGVEQQIQVSIDDV